MNLRSLSLPALLLIAAGIAAQDVRMQHLQTEHLIDPLGLDAPHPRFSWQMQSPHEGAVQKAYRIVVGTDSARVAAGQGSEWDSGTVASSAMLVHYGGQPLRPYTTYFWKVIGTDESGSAYASEVARFETGMMEQANWRGSWIDDGQRIDYLPAPYFRRAFTLGKPVRSARIYIAAAGLYELSLNGQRVGDHMLDPLYTRFDRRNLYVTYDVTTQLQQGENVVGVVLGNGWYNHQSIGVWDFERAPWRNRPAFCLDLRITYEDGTQQTIATDYSWRSGRGEIVQNNIYTGEHRDFTRTQKGWNMPGFDDSRWRGVHLRGVPSQNVTAQQAVPIRKDKEWWPYDIWQVNDSTWLFAFDRNFAGVTHLRAKGPRGTVLHIRHGERLHKDGSLDQSNIDVYFRGDREKDPFQTDVVTLSGEEDDYTTQFNYKGFHYAQVTVTPARKYVIQEGHIIPPAAPDAALKHRLHVDFSRQESEGADSLELRLTAVSLHSDVAPAGCIESSNPIIQKLMRASQASYLSNLMGLPTDCPQREKNGWTGDGHLAIEAGLYNYDGITVYEKWMADHRDEQQPNGVLPDIIPTGGWGYGTDNGLDWTSTIAIIPWTLYLFYGDDEALRLCYPNIKRYVNYVDKNYPNHLTTWGRGDWVPVTVGSNKEFTSSVYFYTDARILARAAKMFGYEADAAYYGKLAEDIREAINTKFLHREEGIYASGTQTELAVPLHWGIVPDDMKAQVAARLNEKVVAAGYHLDVGVLGCKALLNALCENGYAETAYRVAVQDTYPSWGWWVSNGATTLLENWNLQATRDISDNHMMFGEIGAWFYKGIGGIYPDADDPGFHHILLRPYFPTGLNKFLAQYDSAHGTIRSSFERKGKRVTYTVEIPTNSYATLTLPDGREQQLQSGLHVFEVREKTRK